MVLRRYVFGCEALTLIQILQSKFFHLAINMLHFEENVLWSLKALLRRLPLLKHNTILETHLTSYLTLFLLTTQNCWVRRYMQTVISVHHTVFQRITIWVCIYAPGNYAIILRVTTYARLILGLCQANGRRHCFVMTSLVNWVQA